MSANGHVSLDQRDEALVPLGEPAPSADPEPVTLASAAVVARTALSAADVVHADRRAGQSGAQPR